MMQTIQSPVGSREEKRQWFKAEMRNLFQDPVFYLTVAVLVAQVFLHEASVYVFLKSFVVAPSGLFAYLFIGVCGAVMLYGWTFTIRQGVVVKRARMRGEPIHLRHRPTFCAHIALILTIGPAVALSLWSGMKASDKVVQSRGKTLVIAPARQLRLTIAEIERRGVFNLID